MAFDLIVRGGRVVDGTGFPAYVADIGVRDGRIVEIGRLKGAAGKVLDADGLVVAPGFIDHHTHYDAQLLWDPLGSSSCWHGVTTVVTGNCSLSLAPVKPEDRDGIVGSFVRVEAISRRALEAGVDWAWQSFGEYLDRLERERGINVACHVGHSAVRQYVLGEEAVERAATEDEVARMREVLREALEAGAIGFSVNQTKHHHREDGRPIPACVASRGEILALAEVLAEVGAGVLQMNAGAFGSEVGVEDAFAFLKRLAEVSGRPVLFNQILQREGGTWKEMLERARALHAAGYRVHPTSNTFPLTMTFTLLNMQLTFGRLPAWRDVVFGTPAERKAILRDRSRRPALRENAAGIAAPLYITRTHRPENKQWEKQQVADLAAALGKHPVDALLDLAESEDFATEFKAYVANGDREKAAEILREPGVLIGTSDAGAHTVFQADYGYCTELVGPWVRERGLMRLEEAVSRLTLFPAAIFGLHDRGQLRPGFAADLVLFDPETVGPGEPYLADDYPAGERRLVQPARGIRATVVNGVLLTEDGRATGALPGRVLRNARAAGRAPA